MADNADNWTSISSNCSNNTVKNTTYDQFGCSVGFYIHVGLICITILPFNIWALHLITKTATHRSFASSDLLHFNLFFASVICCITYVINGFLNNSYFSYVSAYICNITLMAQVQFYTWICTERYLAVVHPIVYHKLKQSWYKWVWVSSTWVTSTVFAGVLVFMKSKIALFLYMLPFCGFIVLILFCGVPTLARLKKPNPGERERVKQMHYQKIKAFRIIALTLVVVIFTYCPFMCLIFVWEELRPETLCIARAIFLSLVFTGAVFPSLVYIFCFYKE